MSPVALCAVALAAIVIAGCGSSSGGSSAASAGGSSPGAKKLTTFNIALNNNVMSPGLAFVWVGQYLGYYKQQGINLHVVTTAGPPDAINRLESGEVQAAIPPAASIVNDSAKGKSLGLLATFLVRPHGQYEFAVTQNSPITSLSQLVGKNIGVSNLADEGVAFSQYEMQTLGKPRSAVHIIPVGEAGEAATELRSGQVDALALPVANYSQIGSLGVKLRFLVPPWESQAMGNIMWMKKSFVDANQDLVQRFINAYTKSQLFFMNNPKAAVQISFKMYPQTLPAGMSESAALAQTLPATERSVPTFEPKGTNICPKYGCFSAAGWAWYLKYLGIPPGKVQASSLYTNQFVDKANQQDLNAVISQAKSFSLGS